MPETNFSHYSVAADDSEFLLAIIGFDFSMHVLNRTWERLLGYPSGVLLEKPLLLLVDKDEHVLARMLIDKRIAGVSDRPIEFSLHCQDGSYKCFAWMSSPSLTGQEMFISGRDITERKKAETTDNLQRYLQAKKTDAI
jgi:PAS domain S-box-containing protein